MCGLVLSGSEFGLLVGSRENRNGISDCKKKKKEAENF
jgi:hypothetical protein